MAPPIQLIVRKKIYRPVIHEKYNERAVWITVLKLTNSDTESIFKALNNQSCISNEAQFLAWLKERIGLGVFNISAFRKGKCGLYSFLKVELKEDGYLRLPKRQSREDKMIIQNIADLKNKEKILATLSDPEDKKIIQEEIYDMQEEHDFDKEIENITKVTSGPYPYLKSKKPLYAFHTYESYNEEYVDKIADERAIERQIRKENKEIVKEEIKQQKEELEPEIRLS